MSTCPRCSRYLTRAEAIALLHRCDDGVTLVPCGSLETFVEPGYHAWLHEQARLHDAEIVKIPGAGGLGQPFLWQLPYPRMV